MNWISTKDRPLIHENENGHWITTDDGSGEFLAAVYYNKEWWIKHCVIESYIGLCVVGDDYNDPAGWHAGDVSYWMPLPPPPENID